MDISTRINLAIVDDHTLVREGLKLILKQYDDILITLEAENGKTFLDQLETTKVDVVLLDLEMPIMDGKEVLKYLREKHVEIEVIMITMHQHDSFIANMMQMGASGYLLKESKPEELIQAIRTVKHEGIFFNQMTSKALLGKVVSEDTSTTKNLSQRQGIQLNQRELDILKLICEENTSAQIADKLFLSPKTIEGYRKNLLEKTEAKNVVGLVKYAIKHRLI